ncbi:Putative uncharacterized protein [Moritella viscosa]|nr:Putative uncharacterized protein [Moritella viscosa]
MGFVAIIRSTTDLWNNTPADSSIINISRWFNGITDKSESSKTNFFNPLIEPSGLTIEYSELTKSTHLISGMQFM